MASSERAGMPTPATAALHVALLPYFVALAYAANMAAPFAGYWTGWNRPISRRWLGEHKTVVGLGLGVVAAIAVPFIQSPLAWSGALVDYDHWAGLGLRFGLGAMSGDALKSLVKRRVGIAPGAPWIPWDQLDFALGALVLVWGRTALARGTWPRSSS
jgi:CDP-2,3-bis-(O-geranylgeranyl)-sn-glycerol synthase